MTYPPQYAPPSATRPAPDVMLMVVGGLTIAAPLLGVMAKLPTGGWLMVALIWSGFIWVAGYIVLVLAVSLGMLRRRAPLRTGSARTRAIIWALLTSVGIIVLGFTLIDGGDTRESIQSTLTASLGAPESGSTAHAVSEAIAWLAAAAWLLGYAGLIMEWIVGSARARRPAPQVAAPVIR